MKHLVIPAVLLVGLAAWVGITGEGRGWWHGWPGEQSMGMHRGMRGMTMWPREVAPLDAPAALSQYACTSCHALHDGGVGPAFSWVAWRYRGQRGAQASVAAFIAQGGPGPWGGVMPNLGVPSAQADELALWILALPPEPPPDPERFQSP